MIPSPSSSCSRASATVRHWFAQAENQLLLLSLLAAFPLYYQLGHNSVQLWDESRVAVNSVEMARNGHWLVPHYGGLPDHWNTKPPLLIWLNALSLKAFGYSTWALRLPTLLATMGTVLLLFRFAARTLKRPLAGLFATIVLATCAGYVRLHVARTGDYDALLTFWQVLLWTSFFEYLETGHRRYLKWVTLGLIAATMTKGPAGLFGLLGLAAYALGRGKIWWLLRQPGLYVAAGSWAAAIGGYFLIREASDPGYWQAVQANDLGGRFLTALEGHAKPWDFYLDNARNFLFSPWLWAVLPALLVAGVLQPTGVAKRMAWLLVAFICAWLLIISLAQSKLEWYDAPIYPALALLVGLGLSIVYQDLMAVYLSRLRWFGRWSVQVGVVVILVYGPYYTIVRQLIDERHSNYGLGFDGYLGRYLTKIASEQPQIDQLTVLTQGMEDAVLRYYKLEFEQVPGHHLTLVSGLKARKLLPGTTVTTCDPAFRAPLDSAFRVVELHQDASCQTLLLLPLY